MLDGHGCIAASLGPGSPQNSLLGWTLTAATEYFTSSGNTRTAMASSCCEPAIRCSNFSLFSCFALHPSTCDPARLTVLNAPLPTQRRSAYCEHCHSKTILRNGAGRNSGPEVRSCFTACSNLHDMKPNFQGKLQSTAGLLGNFSRRVVCIILCTFSH